MLARSSGPLAKAGEPHYGSSVSSFLQPPIHNILPALPMQRIEPALPMLKIEPALPMLNMEPALPMLSRLKILPTLPMLNKLPAPNKPAPLVATPRAILRFRPERVALRIREPLYTSPSRVRRSAYRRGRVRSTRSYRMLAPLLTEELPERLLRLYAFHWVFRLPGAEAAFEGRSVEAHLVQPPRRTGAGRLV